MNYLIPVIIAFVFSILFSGCGGRSEISGEVVPIEEVCRFEKLKAVAVEGFLAPATMRCERASNKKMGGITGCRFEIYANRDLSGASLPVYILTSGRMSGKNNRIEGAENYTGGIVVRDRDGNPLPKKELKLYDNEGNLIPTGSKIRVHSKLPDADRCEFALAERIDKIS